MSDTIQARYIQNMPWGGIANQGNVVLFDLTFKDGARERYAFDLELGQLLLGNLHKYAEMASNVKVKGVARAVESSTPYRVTRVARSGYSLDGKNITLEFATTHGFPVAVAMTPDQAKQTIEFLQREILNSESPSDNRN